METRSQRRTRPEHHHRIVAVTGACALALGIALVLAACGRTDATADTVLRVRTVRERHTTSNRVVRPTTTTTSTTRPAVNPDTGPPPANTGTGKRIVYCNFCQRVWLVDETDYVVAAYSVSGRRGTPRPGVYHVFRKLEMGRSKAHPELRLPYFVGFAWGSTTDIGFHGIPLRPDGSQIESDAQLGQPLSSGCVRESQMMARALYEWTPEGTPVVVTP
jgi:hypothetical protein